MNPVSYVSCIGHLGSLLTSHLGNPASDRKTLNDVRSSLLWGPFIPVDVDLAAAVALILGSGLAGIAEKLREVRVQTS